MKVRLIRELGVNYSSVLCEIFEVKKVVHQKELNVQYSCGFHDENEAIVRSGHRHIKY